MATYTCFSFKATGPDRVSSCEHYEEVKEFKFCPHCGRKTGILNWTWVAEDYMAKFSSEYEPILEGEGQERAWYSRERWMTQLSEEFPLATFILDCSGEDHPNLWREYYHNGQMQKVRAIITYPEVNWDNEV